MSKYDLEERTAKFGENVILFCRKFPKDEARQLWTEAKELHLIFNSIYRKIGIRNIGHSLGQLDQLVQLE